VGRAGRHKCRGGPTISPVEGTVSTVYHTGQGVYDGRGGLGWAARCCRSREVQTTARYIVGGLPRLHFSTKSHLSTASRICRDHHLLTRDRQRFDRPARPAVTRSENATAVSPSADSALERVGLATTAGWHGLPLAVSKPSSKGSPSSRIASARAPVPMTPRPLPLYPSALGPC